MRCPTTALSRQDKSRLGTMPRDRSWLGEDARRGGLDLVHRVEDARVERLDEGDDVGQFLPLDDREHHLDRAGRPLPVEAGHAVAGLLELVDEGAGVSVRDGADDDGADGQAFLQDDAEVVAEGEAAGEAEVTAGSVSCA